MKESQVMKERIQLAYILCKKLGMQFENADDQEDMYTADITEPDGFSTAILIDSETNFLEIMYSFLFSESMFRYIKNCLRDINSICYEYGCYTYYQVVEGEIMISVFSKIYYSGLNYNSLQDTLQDFKYCIESMKEVVDVSLQ